jgi:antitoxin (DNA-binding transcriptional repressor) of toxin-antitoxin stability system
MSRVTIEEAEANLSELIHNLKPDEELVITENDHDVARLVPTAVRAARRQLGTLRGTVTYMAPDFDAPLEEFKEYMEY